MPTISLRLTEQEHEALKEWARDSRRSMQREAVYRIFAEHSLPSGAPPTERQLEASVERIVSGRGLNYDQVDDPHFKPDPKR